MAETPGPFNVVRKNVPNHLNRDFYHDLLTQDWWKTLVSFVAFYVAVNAVFATLYWLDPNSLKDSSGSWFDCFNFSVQTLGTIGYGSVSPNTTYAHALVFIQACLGLIIFAIMTGFFFSKFARPFAKIEFTEKMVINDFEGKPTLQFRMLNIRRNQIIDSTVSMVMLKEVKTKEGHSFRKFIDLKLVRSKVPFFSMSMTIMHVIDDQSPLLGLTKKDFEQDKAEVIVTAMGTDSTFGQTIHATHLYRIREILWDKRFKDIVTMEEGGTRVIDYAGFNEIL